jgi:hypothetical protein
MTEAGRGRTVNLSSQGSLIAAENHGVHVGAKLEIVIEWPVLLNRTVPLDLKILGRVVRSDKSSFGVAFTKT